MICLYCARTYLGKCDCAGAKFNPPATPKKAVCIHRGDQAGRLSCGCGIVYHCNKLGIVCSDRRPKEDLYTITLNMPLGSMQLDEKAYRCCGECDDFVAADSGDKHAGEQAPSPG